MLRHIMEVGLGLGVDIASGSCNAWEVSKFVDKKYEGLLFHCPEKSGSFPAGAMVQTPEGSKTMEQLRVGDKVLTSDVHGEPIFEDVYFFGHADPNIVARSVSLSVKCKDVSMELELTPDHFLQVCPGEQPCTSGEGEATALGTSSLNNPGLEGTCSSGLAPLLFAIFIMLWMALVIVALSARQQQSIEKQKSHRKAFWHPRPKQSLLLVIAVSSGMLLTGCGQKEYTSLEEAQEGVCSSPPCPQYCLECVKLRWDTSVALGKETIHHWFQYCANPSKQQSCSERLEELRQSAR